MKYIGIYLSAEILLTRECTIILSILTTNKHGALGETGTMNCNCHPEKNRFRLVWAKSTIRLAAYSLFLKSSKDVQVQGA